MTGYGFFLGIASFSTRAFAVEQLTLPNFLVAWYSGGFVGSLLIRPFVKNNVADKPLTKKDVPELALFSSLMFLTMLLLYWAMQLAPLTVVQPVVQVGEMVVPALVGLYVFGERKGLTRFETLLFAVGVGGAVLITVLF